MRYGKGCKLEVDKTLSNGRTNYLIFEELIRKLTGLQPNSSDDFIDHVDSKGVKYEQKSFRDETIYKSDHLIHCAKSSFFANNSGQNPYSEELRLGGYRRAKNFLIRECYSKADFYIFTNTSRFSDNRLFKYFVVSSEDLINNLDGKDPTKVSRNNLLNLVI